jgi:hypothetical protein
MLAADTVVFAIRASLRLYRSMGKAYADSTRGKALVLPLPRAPGIEVDSAVSWFTLDDKGREVAAEHTRVQRLVSQDDLSALEERELTDIYQTLYAKHVGFADMSHDWSGGLEPDEMGALLEIRQWSLDEDAPRTLLQQIAGSVVNIAVDYFAQTPGAVSMERPQGRALHGFLQAIDHVDFANSPVADVAGEVLVGVLDGVAANPGLMGGGEKEQQLVIAVTSTLATSAKKHLATDAPTTDKWQAGVWLGLSARALIKGGADTVLANPSRFFHVDEPSSRLIEAVGGTVAALVIGEQRVSFRPLMSAEGLETVTRSALVAVARNPRILRADNRGIENILVALAKDLASRPRLASDDLFPDMARLVLERTADNLDLLWGKTASKPGNHLLVVATRSLMRELARPRPGATWSPSLTPVQILDVAELVLDEVVDNPQWLLTEAGEANDRLSTAVAAILESLAKTDGRRLNSETGVQVLLAGIQAVSTNVSLLRKLPPGGRDAGRVALSAILDAIFATAFADEGDADARWRLAQNSSIEFLIDTTLPLAAEAGAGQDQVDQARQVLESLAKGESSLEDLAADLKRSLAEAL